MRNGGIDLHRYVLSNNFHKRLDSFNSIFRDISEDLYHLHQNDLLHRDIKPTNIVYDTKSDKSRLIDFGSLKYPTDDKLLDNDNLTTHTFSSPELLEKKLIHKPNDIFALGMTIIFYFIKYYIKEEDIKNNTQLEKYIGKFTEKVVGHLRHEIMSLVLSMVSADHTKRPCIDDVYYFFSSDKTLLDLTDTRIPKTIGDTALSNKLYKLCINNNYGTRCFVHSSDLYTRYTEKASKKISSKNMILYICLAISLSLYQSFSNISVDYISNIENSSIDEVKEILTDVLEVLDFQIYPSKK